MFNLINFNLYFNAINHKKVFSYYKWNLFFFKFIKLRFIKKKLKFFNKIFFKYYSLKKRNTFFFKRKMKTVRPYSYFKFSIIKYTRTIIHKQWYSINNYLRYANFNLNLVNLYIIKLHNQLYMWNTKQNKHSLFLNKYVLKLKKFKFINKKILFCKYIFNYTYYIKFFFIMRNKKIKRKLFKLSYKLIAFLYKWGRYKRYYFRKYKSKLFFKKKKFKKILKSKYKFKKTKFKKTKFKKTKFKVKRMKIKWQRVYKRKAYRLVVTYMKYRSKFLRSKKKYIRRTVNTSKYVLMNRLTNYTLTNKFNFKSNWLNRNILFLKRYFNTYNYKTKLWRIII